MKPLLVTAFSWTPGCEKFFETYAKHSQNAELMLFFYEGGKKNLPELLEYLAKLRISPGIVLIKKPWQGNTARFIEVYKHFRNYPEAGRQIVMTDTHDVFFQGPIPETLDFTVCPEDKKFKEVEFWAGRSTENLKDKDIYNVGCFSAPFESFMGFLEILSEKWLEMVEYIKQAPDDENWPFECGSTKVSTAAFFNHVADTIVFNEFLQINPAVVDSKMFCCHNFSVEQKKVKVSKGIYTNQDDSLPSIVHQNGDVGKRKKYKESK